MKQIPEFLNYAITKDGKVWSCNRNKWLKYDKSNKGYLRVTLCKNGKTKHKYIHRLILETYVGKCLKGMECRHLDGNKLNNELDNLQWGTHSDNAQDAMRHKTYRTANQNGESNTQCKLTEQEVRMIVYMWKTGLYAQKEIANIYNISRRNVSHIVCKRTWKHIWSK